MPTRVLFYAEASVNADTLARWNKGLALYHTFAVDNALGGRTPPYPAVPILCHFAAWLADSGVGPRAVQRYVLGVARWAQNNEPGRGDPRLGPDGKVAFALYSVMRGIRRLHSRRKPLREALTVDKLRVLFAVLGGDAQFSAYERSMWRALLSLGVFGLCRVGELVAPKVRDTIPGITATLQDVHMFYHAGAASHYEFTIKASKQDIFRSSVTIRVFATGGIACPVRAMDEYLQRARGRPRTSPLFVRGDGRYVTRAHVDNTIRSLASSAGFNPSRFTTHSMRAGGATSLSMVGIDSPIIKQMGRWASEAYQVYIRADDDTVRAAMRRMAGMTERFTTRAALAAAANSAWERLRPILL